MLIYDILHKEKVYQIIESNLRALGVKYRLKKFTQKLSKPERSTSAGLKKVFNTSLTLLPLDVVPLASGAIVHVPVFVCQAAQFLLKNVSQEGLFRKAGSQARQKEIMARLDNGGGVGDKYSPVDIASCLKTFFRNLPEPLIPFMYHDLFVRCNMLKTHREEALLLACLVLPSYHLNTLAYFMEFLNQVASYDKQNKMSVDNLARVIGPNVMPLQETTMIAMQTRLEAHLTIVKFLIENAHKIGVIPEEITEALSMDSLGSIENDLDLSDPSSFQRKKKKHRSGSLTRMFSGLKKMVGKNSSPVGNDLQDVRLLGSDGNLNTPAHKIAKKRKVIGSADLLSSKKQRPTNNQHSLTPSSSISSNLDTISKNKTTAKILGVQKYLPQKPNLKMSASDKFDKIKKSRLSLDRLVPKNKNKSADANPDLLKKNATPRLQRSWSSASVSSDSKKCRRALSTLAMKNSTSEKNLVIDELMLNADVNLSSNENSCEQVSQQEHMTTTTMVKQSYSTRRSLNTYFLRNNSQQNSPKIDFKVDEKSEDEYVKIPKSEYEEIKSRVSAIESRISQELKNISDEDVGVLAYSPISKVQNEYEKTLDQAGMESFSSTDQLAKRLSRELKIRKSSEHKVVRSPSARKIGSLRRKSQDQPIRKLHRNSTWHVADRPILRSSLRQDRLLLTGSTNQLKCNLKRSKPILKRDPSSKPTTPILKMPAEPPQSFCSDETNTRLRYLHEQLNTLISQTAEHTKGTFDDDDFNFLDDEEFELPQPTSVKKSTKEKTVTWKDADNYFSQEAKHRTPVPQTGRASVAKLRTQNAGMVLAKAKLFDDAKPLDLNPRRLTLGIPRVKELRNLDNLTQLSPGRKSRKTVHSPRSRTRPDQENRDIFGHHKNQFKRNSVAIVESKAASLFDTPTCKTPHIKKPLNVKTPRSAKSLSRRAPVSVSKRTPLKAVLPITPKRQSPRVASKASAHNR